MAGTDCPACGRRREETPISVLNAWSQSGLVTCPPCIDRALGKPAVTVTGNGRCGGCGRKTSALSADELRRCARCEEEGVIPLNLFEGV